MAAGLCSCPAYALAVQSNELLFLLHSMPPWLRAGPDIFFVKACEVIYTNFIFSVENNPNYKTRIYVSLRFCSSWLLLRYM